MTTITLVRETWDPNEHTDAETNAVRMAYRNGSTSICVHPFLLSASCTETNGSYEDPTCWECEDCEDMIEIDTLCSVHNAEWLALHTSDAMSA